MISRLLPGERLRWPAVLGLMLAFAVPGGGAAGAKPKVAAPAPPASAGPAVPSFDAFRLIGDRNIFNPNRMSRSSRDAKDQKPPRIDTISFVGTMQYEKGLFAFFDSPDSKYRKALHEGEDLAEFKVKRITADHVQLTRDTREISLKMAEQLRRAKGGDWTVVGADVARNDARVALVAAAADVPEIPVPPPIPADASEALRRLMEQRQKQLKQ